MSAKSTQRANTKEKPKPQQTQLPNKDVSNTKLKATAEQMRIAQIISDKTDHTEDSKLKIIKQVQEMTHKSQDEVVIVLHDCDFDMNKAINMLLEGVSDQGEWHETGKKKKRVQASVNNHSPEVPESKQDNKVEKREKSSDRGDSSGYKDRSESSSRGGGGRRNDAIPRFQRGGKTWRGKENEENDRNRTDSNDRGRGRGRGGRGGRGRGRGGGRGNRGSGGERGGSNRGSETNNVVFDNGPQIDTWTNDQAVQKKNNWMGSGIEDWDNDTWTGNLNETKVFTATSIGNNLDSSPIQETNTMNSMTNNSLSNSLTSSLTANLEFNQTNSITQSLDLGPILQPKAPGSGLDNDLSSSQTSDSLSRYTKQATESIKSIVGIGNSSSLAVSQANVGLLATSMSSGPICAGQQPISVSQSPVASQRPKPQRSKLPPPSKIPASAVEMPGHMATSHMDVQFGFGTDQSTLSFGSDTSTGLTYSNNAISGQSAGMGNHMPVRTKTPEPTTTMSAILANITPPKSSAMSLDATNTKSRSSVFPGSAASTPTKDYTQSPIKTGIAAPEPIPFPSPNDRKTSPMMVSQRPQSGDTATSLGAYSSSYPTSGYKNSTNATTTSAFTHSTNSLTSAPSGGLQQQQQQQSGGYQSSRAPYQSGYQSFQNQAASLYQNNSQSTYGNQNTSYQRDTSYSSSQPGSYQATQNQSNAFNTSQSASTGVGAGTGYTTSQSSAVFQSGQSSYNTVSGQTSYPSSQQTVSSAYPQTVTGSSASYPHAQSGGMSNYSGSNQSTAYSSGQSNNAYQSNHSVNSYPTSVSSVANNNTTYPSAGQSQTTGAAFGSYGSSSHQSAMNAAKLGETLSKMGVKDAVLDSTTNATYEHSTSSVPSVPAAGSTVAPPSSATAVNNTNNLGLTTSTVSPTTSTSKISSSLSNTTTTKAPPNLPPGVPLTLGPNFIMGQHGIPPYFGLQQPVYSYEDLQILQQRLPLPGYYDTSSLPFQPPTSLATNRDQTNINNTAGVPYSATNDASKMSRVDAQSPVQATQQNTQQQPAQSAAHQQAYISPGALPPGYGYYYHSGIMPGSFQYTTPAMFPVPQTNAAHAANTSAATAQYQKQPTTGYGTHAAYGNAGYEDMSQPQDFSKTGYNAIQHSVQQNKAGGVAPGTMKAVVSTAASDMSGTAYGKSHTQVGLSFDKQGFHGGTPPPYNLAAMQSGTQAGPMGPTNPYAQFVPMMTHHSQLMHHQLQQDASSGSSRGTQQQTGSQVKPANKNFSTAYWSN